MAGVLDLMDYVQTQGEIGKKQGEQRRFRSLAPKIASGDDSAYSEGLTLDPAGSNNQMSLHERQLKQARGAAEYMKEAVASGNPTLIQSRWQEVRPALSKIGGQEPPEVWGPEVEQKMGLFLSQTKYLDRDADSALSADHRSFEAQIAHLSPEDQKKARRIKLRLDPGAVAKGAGYSTETDQYGNIVQVYSDPAKGIYAKRDAATGEWVQAPPPTGDGQMGGAPPMGAPPMGAPPPQMAPAAQPTFESNGMPVQIDPSVPPHLAAAIMGNPDAAAQADTIKLPPVNVTPQQRATGAAPSSMMAAAPPPAVSQQSVPSYGQSKSDEARTVETAKQQVQLEYLAEKERIQRESAIAQAGGIAETQADVSLTADTNKREAGRSRDANDVLGFLDQAEVLIPLSTGSGIGELADKAGAFVGYADRGAQSIASLKTISGQLVAKMPRMEGPQSDKDVQMYKDMAGNLADPSLPRESRMAALREVRRLNEKYAGRQQSEPVRIKSAADYEALPRGAEFIAPDGTLRRKR